jgi:hypothetical protein
VTTLLRIEGGALLAAAAAGYGWFGGSPWLFLALFLAPDLSMAGYLAGSRIGAWTYNAFHTTLPPLALLSVGLWTGSEISRLLALVWLAHIGFDRALGYGLKRATGFGDTHLGTIGRRAPAAERSV